MMAGTSYGPRGRAVPPSASWTVQLREMVSGHIVTASGDQENRGLVYFKDIPPKELTKSMLTIAVFAQPDRVQVLNQGRDGSLLAYHEGLLMGTECHERDFRCRVLIFMHHE